MEGFDQPEVVDNVVEDEVTRDDDPKSDMSNEDFPQDKSNSFNSKGCSIKTYTLPLITYIISSISCLLP